MLAGKMEDHSRRGGPSEDPDAAMLDKAIETVVDLERQLLALYQEVSALRDFEDEAVQAGEGFDDLIARLKVAAHKTIDDVSYLVAHTDRANTDKASLIVLLAIGLAGEVRASEEAKKQTSSQSTRTYFARSLSDDPPRKDL
jgi:hypothetical protein